MKKRKLRGSSQIRRHSLMKHPKMSRRELSLVVTPAEHSQISGHSLMKHLKMSCRELSPVVIPAQAGIQNESGKAAAFRRNEEGMVICRLVDRLWIPACAGMTT